MTKLCPRGKAAAKRKFAVYPSAYANAYASRICAGKIKDPSGKKRKDFKGPKPAGKVAGGMTAGSMSAMGRLQKARMMNKGGDMKDLPSGLRKDTTTSAYGDAGKGRPVPGFLKDGKPKRPPFRTRPGQSPRGKNDIFILERAPKKNTVRRKKMKVGGDAKIKKVAKALHKASGLHKQQAKTLDTISRVRGGGIAIRGLNFQGVK